MENDKQKTSRASQTRVKEQKKTTWTPPSNLDAPPAPAGFRHRWLRAELLGQDDSRNICLLYTSPSPRDGLLSRMPSSA